MVGQIDDRPPVRRRSVTNPQRVRTDQRELDLDVNGTRIPLFPVDALVAKGEARRALAAAASDLPDLSVEAEVPSMKMMRSLVAR